MSETTIMQVLMHEVLRKDFETWLTGRGLVLQRCPFLDEGPDLPVYNVAPRSMAPDAGGTRIV